MTSRPVAPGLRKDALRPASAADVAAVEREMSRSLDGAFEVVVEDLAGRPVVIRNAPFLFDGTPMPTLYWLVGSAERRAVGELEASGGVRRAEEAVDAAALEEAHRRYALERDSLVDPSYEGPRPRGGVGGTRRGVKCLHAHYAWYLAGGDDPVGVWVAQVLGWGRDRYRRRRDR